MAAHIAEDPAYYQKISEKSKKTKRARHGDPNWVNPEKAKDTNMRLRGVDSPMKNSAIKEKSKNTFRRNHPGLTSSFELPGVYEKAVASFIKKYGVDNPFKNKDIYEKGNSSRRKKYGNECIFKIQEFQDRIRKRRLKLYGSEYYHGVKYNYNGMFFDSSWEVAVWIFCSDFKIDIKREPVHFLYLKDGKKITYIPDFEIDGKLVEIKGNQFKSDKYGWIDPWTKKPLTEKYQCAVKNGVAILYYEDIKYALEYVFRKYGKKYISQFKTKK